MKRIIVLCAAVLSLSAFVGLSNWKIDKGHAKLAFSITHMGISDVWGSFKNYEVDIQSSKADFSDAVFTLSADVASIDTDIEARDKHLLAADFFDAEKYPKFTFKSTSIKPAGKDKYKLTGDLTLHGVTKPVTFDLWHRGTIENPMSKAPTAGFQVTGTIKRSDFGIGTGYPAPMLSDEVKIMANGEFGKE
ncbi:MAG TPA: YceI family protein [Flavisolibacter sp.]|nr:YceI family protein [Flavisolibacter sp.]